MLAGPASMPNGGRWPITLLRAGLGWRCSSSRSRRLPRGPLAWGCVAWACGPSVRGLGLVWTAAIALLAMAALALRDADAVSLGQATLRAKSF